MVIIKACMRSGTHFTATYLQRAGFGVGHEHFKRDGVVGWMYAPIAFDKAVNVVGHQVRHPIRTIESLHTIDPRAWQVVARFLPLSPSYLDSGDLVSLMQYWVQWNEFAEKTASFTYRVEDQLDVLGAHLTKPLPEETPPVDTHSRRNDPRYVLPLLTLRDFKTASEEWFNKLMEAAERYGYSL